MSKRLQTWAAAAVVMACAAVATADPVVKDGDVVAIIGDSITEARTYGVLVEDYLLMCQPAKVRVMQFGWGGETVEGFNGRQPDFAAMKPTVATTCYGMNDGHYTRVTDAIKNAYHAGLLKGVQTLQKSGVRVVVGSNGCVDPATFANLNVSGDVYNENLTDLKDEAAAVARTTGSAFADVNTPMRETMIRAKAAYGLKYAMAPDGVHPGFNGALPMALAFLKAMGFDGNVGTLYVDLNAHTAKAFGGHELVKADGNAFTFKSTRYPFCFGPDNAAHTTDAGTRAFVPFDADLNRFTLTAAGPAKAYKVTWGEASKTFTAEQLKAGVNLATEFPDNPFVKPFLVVQQKIAEKQGSEILLLKQLLHSAIASKQLMPGEADKLDAVTAALPAVDAKLSADVAADIVPVTHTLTFEPVE